MLSHVGIHKKNVGARSKHLPRVPILEREQDDPHPGAPPPRIAASTQHLACRRRRPPRASRMQAQERSRSRPRRQAWRPSARPSPMQTTTDALRTLRRARVLRASDIRTHRSRSTEALNVPSIVGQGSACEIALASFARKDIRLESLRSRLFNRIANQLYEMGFELVLQMIVL